MTKLSGISLKERKLELIKNYLQHISKIIFLSVASELMAQSILTEALTSEANMVAFNILPWANRSMSLVSEITAFSVSLTLFLMKVGQI